MRSVLAKETLRSIKRSKGRFLAIIGIVALGCGFFAGLQMSGLDMTDAADRYYDGTNLYDIRVLSTDGFEDADVERISQIDGVEAAMGSTTADFVARLGKEQVAIRISSLNVEDASSAVVTSSTTVESDDDSYLNRVVLKEGEWPDAPDECVISADVASSEGFGIGDTVEVLYGTSDVDDVLVTKTFTVVGLVSSSNYPYGGSLGTTTLGDGSIKQYLYVEPDAFADSYPYTEVYVKVEGAADEVSGSDEYQALVDEVSERIDSQEDYLASARLDDIKADAQAELDDKRAEYEESKAKAEQELADAQSQLDDAAATLAESREELDSGWSELESGQQQLSSGWEEYQNGVSELSSNREEAESQLAEAQSQIDEQRATLDQSSQDLDEQQSTVDEQRFSLEEQKSELETQLEQTNQQISSLQQQIAALEATDETTDSTTSGTADGAADGTTDSTTDSAQDTATDEGTTDEATDSAAADSTTDSTTDGTQDTATDDSTTDSTTGSATDGTTDGSTEGTNGNASAQLEQLKAALAQAQAGAKDIKSGLDQVNDGLSNLDEVQDQIDSGRAQLQSGYDALDQAQAALDAQKAQVESELSAGESTLDESYLQLLESQSKLDESLAQLEEGEASYADGLSSYEDGVEELKAQRSDVEAQLADAEAQLDEAQEEIDSLEKPDIYELDRTKNEGCEYYRSDSERISRIADVFPAMFFLVAALVALTTMTRMVEDDRVLIGTFKALGYSTRQIASKYLAYAAIASLTGAVLGIAVLTQVLPYIIMASYGVIYSVPLLSFPMPVDAGVALFSGALGVGVTIIATLVAVVSSLRATPASLMLPLAPKAGKRILLERIAPIWKRLSFSWKVTFRNIFRYKRRLLMTLVGISGCTALLLVGFGLDNSIWDIIDRQFGPIIHYDLVVSLDSSADDQDVEDVASYLASDEDISQCWRLQQENMLAGSSGTEDQERVSVVIPEDASDFTGAVTFQERTSGESIAFDENSVIVTEKLASTLGIGVGDQITVYDEDDVGNATGSGYQHTVTGVCENYVGNYVYVGRDAWAQTGKDEPLFSTVYASASLDEDAKEALSDELHNYENVSVVSFMDDTIDSYRTTLKVVDYVVVVLVVSAAALAYIVLYNLTNINISERVREIASLKVLGFTRREVYAYIFREVIIISIMGDFVGMFLGTWLEGFVITTAEVDYVMFGRTIHPESYLISFALTIVFTLIVIALMRRRLDRISMVESLKSVD
ncbi:MAG: FtsX-like permease family protein [Tractidigestivibacter sp.]|jgi:putative ABC transport system permease protein|uniref:FtsX-like permease family protein n=1 Tax=Tractidigestivibacter sp. TaxID=2847320 RepID=UPI003D93798B